MMPHPSVKLIRKITFEYEDRTVVLEGVEAVSYLVGQTAMQGALYRAGISREEYRTPGEAPEPPRCSE
jgi:hypothetical protein